VTYEEALEENTMVRTVLFTAVLVGMFSTPALAQRSRGPASQPFDIDFPGGTLAELIKVIEGKLGSKSNVIATKEALAVVLPDFSLHQVRTKDVLSAVLKLGPTGRQRLDLSSSGAIITVTLQAYPIHKVPKWTRVHDLRDLLGGGGYKIADIVTAIETAWDMGAKERSAQLKFHQETQLLIAMGTEFELDIIDRVLTELRRGGKTKGDEAALKKAADALALAEAQKEKSEAEQELARKKLEDAQRAQARYAQQVASYERQVADLRERLRALSAENNALQKKLQDLEAKKKNR
jgi:hypothetical protein